MKYLLLLTLGACAFEPATAEDVAADKEELSTCAQTRVVEYVAAVFQRSASECWKGAKLLPNGGSGPIWLCGNPVWGLVDPLYPVRSDSFAAQVQYCWNGNQCVNFFRVICSCPGACREF